MKGKRKQRKANKFPKSALAFYIKLYCKQKGSSETKFHTNLVEATKSWVSLSESEREKVQKKFKECEHRFKLQCFTQLKNAETFMKVKDISNCVLQEPEKHAEEIRQNTDAVHFSENGNIGSEDELVTDVGSVEQIQSNITMEALDTNEHASQVNPSLSNSSRRTSEPFLVEPSPPTLKTGKDLFHMLNSTDRGNNMTWISLPQLEKSYYSRAVCLLKKDYIYKYKLYLESLSPRELFRYYNDIIF